MDKGEQVLMRTGWEKRKRNNSDAVKERRKIIKKATKCMGKKKNDLFPASLPAPFY
jgi:vacuolar-type H+-ATPase subunit H